jgi:Rps23 Pro-64 3,4-dihydroxylase Tpa1-like proline 4-hydroxylase
LVSPSVQIDGLPIWVVDNFLPTHDHVYMYLYCTKSLYTNEHSSSPNPEDFYPRFVSNLTAQQVAEISLTAAFTDTINELGFNKEIERVYINMGTPDTVFMEHVDSSVSGITMLYYPNQKWDLSWGGETLFFDKTGDIAFASLAKPNRAIFFDPRILHTARPPTKAAKTARYTIAYKTKED